MRSLASRSLLCALIGLSFVTISQAQNSDPNNDTGLHAYQTYDGARENINLSTGNAFVSVPLLTLRGRNGHNYSVALMSNSQSWSPFASSSQDLGMVLTRTGAILFHPGGIINPVSGVQCLSGYTLSDENGGVHTFSTIQSNCIWVGGGPNQGQRMPQYDALGGGDDRGEGFGANLSTCQVTFKDGSFVPLVTGSSGCPLVGYIGNNSTNAPVLTDSNGNGIQLSAYPTHGTSCSTFCGGGDLFPTGTDTDTLGRAITYSNSNNTIQYKDSN